MKNEILFRIIKVCDIGYITVIYFIVGICLSKIFDTIYGKFNEQKEKIKTMFRQTIELIAMMWVYGIVIYIVKNIIELIPSPFDGIYGFEHLRVKEVKNAPVFIFIFLFFQEHFRSKLRLYYNLYIN